MEKKKKKKKKKNTNKTLISYLLSFICDPAEIMEALETQAH